MQKLEDKKGWIQQKREILGEGSYQESIQCVVATTYYTKINDHTSSKSLKLDIK